MMHVSYKQNRVHVVGSAELGIFISSVFIIFSTNYNNVRVLLYCMFCYTKKYIFIFNKKKIIFICSGISCCI
jgi:hypothetical protein